MEKLVKNYFFNSEIDNWNYKDFNTYMRLLGYKNEEDISKIYNKILKDFADYQPNEQNNNKSMSSTNYPDYPQYLDGLDGKDNCKVFDFLFGFFVAIIICMDMIYDYTDVCSFHKLNVYTVLIIKLGILRKKDINVINNLLLKSLLFLIIGI